MTVNEHVKSISMMSADERKAEWTKRSSHLHLQPLAPVCSQGRWLLTPKRKSMALLRNLNFVGFRNSIAMLRVQDVLAPLQTLNREPCFHGVGTERSTKFSFLRGDLLIGDASTHH